MSLFHNIWSNKHTQAFSILEYILINGGDNSLTWSIHLLNLFKLYELPCPLSLLSQPVWSKDSWKTFYLTKIRVHHERVLRNKATSNSKMGWLNVELCGLNGHTHPILHNITTTRQVEQARIQIKMLSGDYLTLDRLVKDRRSGDPSCRLCPQDQLAPIPPETLPHLLTQCRGTADIRERIFPEVLNILKLSQPNPA